ncbi:tetrapyrrole methylase family protein/MazG family protein [Clostridium tetanomorphum]|uniref:Nucleoside triphosphate pyrophosphohydrolase n=1 Tax=Clostridium tetanomorphum TaxID=1553 RepID=A0A923EAU1_CLOTT|nr:nucleoside triphosphate pyrophosphohydrolase [Clostridium tetanomorphum]KAJ50823.1 MazG family protein [Clostridium tetanomorphum DSM 665]MBC2398314.1 nucleoside triphosphate pyrophosphohydrolase [Clostridium tetanomorphum]MBP1865466.1 tetrapyrrole methylase family protein/MazG family protein [Clostridium tetanomorphum]NRS86412.1 tetrapyrrole methylase family protein/MazG family protein [Clostridium tetanomorphum]NRZ95559.1 tetrapyrrole methylase family protein/MazG family protein [Clostrid
MIKVVGLGPGSKEALTLGTMEVLKNANKIYLRTEKHPTVEYLKGLNIDFETFDKKYDSMDSFDEVYNSIAMDIIKAYDQYKDIVYAVPGHPLVAEKSVNNLIKLCNEKEIELKIFPAVSFIDAIIERLKIDPIEGIKVIDAFDITMQVLDKRIGTIVTQVYNPFIASEVKLALLEYYDDEEEIYFIRAAGIEGLENIRKIKLYELDRQSDIDYLTSLYIPKSLNNTKDFNDLLDIMEKLRGEDGCPWDKEQNHESLKKYLIEESYEVLEAIDKKDDNMIIEELGDVLLQIVFHAQIGKEEGFFNINDIIKGICDKMIERHPHVFGNVEISSSEEVLDNWEEIKKEEKGYKTHTDELKHVAKTLPSLIRAEKIQKKASKIGFDWDKVEDALDKVLEEFYEVKDVYKNNNREKILEEVGDLIFAVVNVARFLDIDPEYALNYTIDKFINRFEYIEKSVLSKGFKMENMTLEEMDELWEKAKKNN